MSAMKLQIYSDLHNDFRTFEAPSTDADIVILAGDINSKSKGVIWAGETFSCPVIYVPGNHEYYGGHLDHTLRKMRDVASAHVQVMDNQTWVWKCTRFLCATAWTDFSTTGDVVAATHTAGEWMNDFRLIRIDDNFRRLRPPDLVKRNHATRDWLVQELDKPFEGNTVVVTHHSPIPEVSGDKHDGHLSAAYTNCWHALVEKADLWIFGHTHRAVDVSLGGCRVVSNPRGYPNEKTGFDPELVVSLS